MARSVAVLGAGIVGISCALHLARRGFGVTLVDRREPGSETSFGNSGVIGRASIVPLSQPAVWRKLARYAANRDRAVRFGPGYPARELGWFARFLANSLPGAFDANAGRLNALQTHALPEHEALLAGDSGLLRRDGWLHLFRTEGGFEASAVARALWYRYGVRLPDPRPRRAPGARAPPRFGVPAGDLVEGHRVGGRSGADMPAARRTVHGRGWNPATRGNSASANDGRGIANRTRRRRAGR